jgi:anti-sigma-K factor RskA
MKDASRSPEKVTRGQLSTVEEIPVDRATLIATSRRISRWMPYAVATGLMLLGIFLVQYVAALKAQLAAASADAARLRQSNALVGLYLVTLEAKDPAYASAQIVVAWDPYQYRGVVSVQNLPAAPAGQNYQLWVLDPNAQTPLYAGALATDKPFAVKQVRVSHPGFAVSLEPASGSPLPANPILFAVAPAL